MAKDGNSLIMLGGLAVAGYVAYEYFFKPFFNIGVVPDRTSGGYTSPGGTGSTSTQGTSTTPTGSTPISTTPAAPSQLDAIYKAMKADITAYNNPGTGDAFFTGSGDSLANSAHRFNFYLQRSYTGTIPDLGAVFADPDAVLTAAQFWAAMAPALKAANSGLTGLGFYGGLGALVGGGW